jgi:hypothetical protein
MEGATRNYSVGNRISYSEAVRIYAAALKHGFSLYFDPDLQTQFASLETGSWPRLRDDMALHDAGSDSVERASVAKLARVAR